MSIYRKLDVDRMRRCITMAMGRLNPLSDSHDERLAWYQLMDALDGREPRATIYGNGGEVALPPSDGHTP